MQSAPLFQSIPEIRIHRIHWGGGGGGRGGGGEQRLSPSKYSPVPHNRSSIVIRRPRLQAVSDPLKLSCPPGPREINAGGDEGRRLLPLPVLIRRSGRASQYAWDGSRLRLVGLDDGKPSYLFPWSLRRLFSTWESTVRKLFVPQQVQAQYMDYLKWKLLHRIFSSALQVLATQAMFRAIGIGSSRSLPSAAALNWVLKDGLGRLSRCIYTASLGSAFDTNLKRVRFSTSILFSLSIGVELLTPAFPQYFLLLATTANIAKSISLAAYIATGSAIHRSFAIADNLGEVSAKAQIQTVCFDNLGLLLAASLNMLCKNNQRLQAVLPFVVYPIFSAVDLLAIYQGLQFVHLQTLTKDRLEIIIDTWIQLGVVPSPAEVSKKEGVYFSRKDSKLWPIRIGCADPKNSLSMASALTLQFLSGKDLYFICTELSFQDLMGKQQGILLCLREMAGTTDIIMGLLQACLIRKMLLREHSCNNIWEGNDADDSMVMEWFTVVEESKKRTWKEINHLTSEIKNAGWAVKNVLLKPKEQIRYSMVSDS